MTSATKVAQLFSITKRRVDQLVADGVLVRHDEGGFELEENVRRYVEWLKRDEETRTERRKLLQAQTAATRMKAQRASHALLSRAEVRRKLQPFIGELWNLRAVATWLYGKLEKITDRQTATVIGSQVHDELSHLIADLRDRIEAQFVDVPDANLEDEMQRLGVPGDGAKEGAPAK